MTPVQKGHGEFVPVSGRPMLGEITVFAEGWIEVVAAISEEEKVVKTRWFPSPQCVQIIWDKDLAVRHREATHP